MGQDATMIDGKLDDEAWKSAQVVDKFMQPWLQEKNRPAKTGTRARLLWDKEFLYFSAELEDHDLFADITEHDGKTWDNDVFELFFKPSAEKEAYYEFQVNAAGTEFDMFIPTRDPAKFDFAKFINAEQFHIDSKVTLSGTLNQRTDKDTGWVVEGKLPWSDFKMTGGRPGSGAVWKFALCRYDFANEFKDGPELSTSAPLKSETKANFHLTQDYASLKFVGPDGAQADRPFGLEKRIPVTTSTVVGNPDPPLPYRWQRRYPNWKITYPMHVIPQPGTDLLLVIAQDSPASSTTLKRIKDDPSATVFETLLVDPTGQLSYAVDFHPQFAKNGYIYIGQTGPTTSDPKSPKGAWIVRYTMDTKPPYKIDPESKLKIIGWLSEGHSGAATAFGHDGMLYVTTGDGTSDSDPNLRGQDMKELTAKVLRIDVDHPAPDKPYSVPADNPFVNLPGAAPETWAYGLRNPWRMTTDKETGHIWVGNNGQDLWEQAFLLQRGANYGWSVMEGSHPFYLNRKQGPTPFVLPTVEHHHTEARSLTGGVVYYGTKLPELRGAYIYGDHSTGKVWGVKHDGQKIIWHKELTDTPFHVAGFGTDSQGELLICDHEPNNEGGFYALIPNTTERASETFPRKLSESGLFSSVAGHVMQPGVIPYSVNAPLWSDGADKIRFMALPGADSKIEFTSKWGWTFPDLTVMVKSFSLELEEGNPASRRFVETRFMTRQQGEWIGYSYLWNDDQTDAVLVSKEGTDREYVIKGKQGERKQVWHYPSRTECMVCHTRAAAFVLGLSTVQMNKDHDYGGIVDNQLRAFDHIGLFKDFNWAEAAKLKLRNELKEHDPKAKDTKEQEIADAELNKKVDKAVAEYLEFSPDKLERLVNPYDAAAPIDVRARSYLHANCAVCHTWAGGGNAQFSAEFQETTKDLKLIDVAPLHDKFGIKDARLVAPASPERSVLLHRMSLRGRGQMPQLATSIVDEAAVRMLKEWISQLKP